MINDITIDTRPIKEIDVGENDRCVLRMPAVMQRTGYKRSYIYSLIQQGKFPKSIKIGVNKVGWDSKEIDRWIDERLSQQNN